MTEIKADTVLPADRRPITIETADGLALVGELATPLGAVPVATLVCLHPLPTHGGMMDSHLLRKAANRLPAMAHLAVLRFNTRGTTSVQGTSQGEFGLGELERYDVAAAVDFAEVNELPHPWLVGWSFGANVAVRAAIDDRRVAALALVGLPLVPGDVSLPPLPDATDLRAMKRPVLLLAGEHDTFAPGDRLRDYATSFPDANAVVIDGTDHYFWRREREAATAISDFVDGVLTRP